MMDDALMRLVEDVRASVEQHEPPGAWRVLALYEEQKYGAMLRAVADMLDEPTAVLAEFFSGVDRARDLSVKLRQAGERADAEQ